MKQAIHQFHSGSAFGDAVTNSLLYTQKILQDLGFESNIYVEHVAPELDDKILHFSQLKSDENNIILIHHSMGHDLDEWLSTLKEKIILVYHNITPAEFFPKESPFYHYSIKGREQLGFFKERSIGYIGDSKLNVDELIEYGYDKQKTEVIPLLIDYDSIVNHTWNYNLFDENSKTFNVLFVGRIAENKGQLELVKMFQIFLEIYKQPSKLFLVGGTSGDSYEKAIRDYIRINNLEKSVVLTGKVSYEDLYAYYHLADAFVCLSDHEGFGVPLIEAMIFDVPVIAYDSSNIKNTLNGSGVLFKEKNLEYIAGFLSILAKNRRLRREIIYTQRDNLVDFQYKNIKYKLAKFLNQLGLTDISLNNLEQIDKIEKDVEIQIEGPFDSTYSLALLNREMAKALEKLKPEKVALFSTEGPGDFEPNVDFLEKNLLLKNMHNKAKKASTVDIVLRNLYPPRVYDAKGLINLTNSYGWEEASFPQEYIENFNKYLDALPVTSKYVQKVMIDNGLVIPTPIVGDGISHLFDVKPSFFNVKTKKSFKFLHISSCFPRKGVDVLLEAYFRTFTADSDVCLVIKTFPNPHNDIEAQISNYQNKYKNTPEIELINQDLEDEYIASLYKQCDCLVAPSRGEGYGLPMAEAMLFELPVITTGFSGQLDFCSNDTAWLIDYDFEKAKTHMSLFNSYWANPKWEHLSKLMQDIVQMSEEEKKQKTKKAKENILSHHRWEDCAVRMLEVVENLKNQPIFEDKRINIGWISTWNTKCGIATYSKFLVDNLSEDVNVTVFANYANEEELFDKSEEQNVKRVWKDAGDQNLDLLYESIIQSSIDTVVIQFNFGFFNVYVLEKFLLKLKESNIKIFITFHSTEDVNKEDFKASLGWISKTLEKVNRLFVHNISDLNILKSFGVVDNVTLFPHGVAKRGSNVSQNIKKELGFENKKIIASYGFLLPHKGIKELIEAFAIVKQKNKDLHLLLVNALYPNPISNEYLDICNATIKKLDLQNEITMINDFLSDDESFKYLDCADLLVMPYKETQESSSAAVRYAISTYKPILCTPINIFNDVSDVVHFSNDCSVKSLAASMNKLINDNKLLYSKNEIQKRWIDEHDWVKLSSRLENILRNKSV